MFKFVTLYRKVDDSEAINLFFSETHLPLAEKLPGLTKSEVDWVKGKPGGESRFYLMYSLYFESEETYQAAMLTEEGLALMQALRPWSDKKLISWFYTDHYESD